MSEKLRISVVIPAHNAGRYIERTLQSVLKQTRAADEIIVVDDGSTDDTAKIVGRYGGRVRLISQPGRGASAARNTGIRTAAGEWIAFLDADDEWLEGYLRAQEELIRRNPHLAWSTGNYITCSCTENRQSPYLKLREGEQLLRGKDFLDDYFCACRGGLPGHTDTMLIKKEALVAAGLFREGQAKANDLDLWWRIAYQQPQIGFIAEPLAIYHLTVPASISKKFSQIELYIELLHRHLELSSQHNRRGAFEPVAQMMLRVWIRGMLFDARGEDIRRLLKEFPNLYPVWYRIWMTLLTTFPNVTASVCRGISRIVRLLHLRRRVVAPPRDTNES